MNNVPWTNYTGEREKTFYFVKTKDGKEYGPCYPNADAFYVMEGEHSGKVLHDEDVKQIKPAMWCEIRREANCESCYDTECPWRLTDPK